MKIKFDNDLDTLYITFNDNKVVETIQLELEMNADIDADNKVVGLEVLHYSKLRQWTNDLLLENGIYTLDKDAIVFYMHHGYITAWFYKADITTHTPCRYYVEGQQVQRDTVENYIQEEVDFIIKHR